jgi:hypothetical protein
VGATAVAALLPVVGVVGLTALANGAVGVDRLSRVGVPIWTFAAALGAEVLGGALLWLAALLVRERQAGGGSDGSGRTDTSGASSASDGADADGGSGEASSGGGDGAASDTSAGRGRVSRR